MYVSILLPKEYRDTPWTILGVHESTHGIFEEVARLAAEAGWRRRASSNVYKLGDTVAVGWWCSLDSFYRELDLRDRLGNQEMSDTMRAALQPLLDSHVA